MCSRALIAVTLLFGYASSSVEATVGELRDGGVHHETFASGVDHRHGSQGTHGHEDVGEAQRDGTDNARGQDDQQGTDHEHGTSGDHCTHTHSVCLPAAYDFDVVSRVVDEFAAPVHTRGGSPLGSLFRPPRV
jgi:hypothetical protein